MTRLQNDRSALFLVVAVLAVLVALGLYVMYYSHGQLASLAAEPAYGSPREGMVRWYRDHGAIRVEISHENQEYPLLRNLWTVGGDVWLEDRDHPMAVSEFFLRTPRGWVLVPEGRFPGIIALGQRLLSLGERGRTDGTREG